MKANLENTNGSIVTRDIDISDTPILILQHLLSEDETAAEQFFADERGKEQLKQGNVDEERSTFNLIDSEGNGVKVCWKTALCEQPAVKQELATIEASGQTPTFVVSVSSIVA